MSALLVGVGEPPPHTLELGLGTQNSSSSSFHFQCKNFEDLRVNKDVFCFMLAHEKSSLLKS